jgi:hypothetical protein
MTARTDPQMTLRDDIIKAFSAMPRPSPDRISEPTYADEGTAAYFGGRSWQGHSAKQLRYHSSSLSFFTVEAFRYYLLAYMLAELDEPEVADVIAESILFAFTKGIRVDELLLCLSCEEREAIARFFDDCATRYSGVDFQAGAARLRRVNAKSSKADNPQV